MAHRFLRCLDGGLVIGPIVSLITGMTPLARPPCDESGRAPRLRGLPIDWCPRLYQTRIASHIDDGYSCPDEPQLYLPCSRAPVLTEGDSELVSGTPVAIVPRAKPPAKPVVNRARLAAVTESRPRSWVWDVVANCVNMRADFAHDSRKKRLHHCVAVLGRQLSAPLERRMRADRICLSGPAWWSSTG
jgi:hypothetical protein